MVLELLGCVARATLKRGGKLLLRFLPLGESIYEIGKDALEDWMRRCDARKRRAEMEALAKLSAAEAVAAAQAAADGVGTTPEEREALAGYLSQMPGVVRRTLSRPGDLRGLTVPAGQMFDKPADLTPCLPLRRSPFKIGQVIQYGKYAFTLVEPLGVGGFGEVWRAQTSDGRDWALKFCLDQNPDSLRSLQTEVDLLGKIGNQLANVVRLRLACLDAKNPFLVYDYASGGDLVRLIQGWAARPPQEGLLAETRRLIRTLARAILPVHRLPERGAHRDLKPSNVLLKPGSDSRLWVPLVSDFGSGGVAAGQALTRSRTISRQERDVISERGAYSLLYSSPQQRLGAKADPADDIYALGVITYQVLMGDVTIEPTADMEDILQARRVPLPFIHVLLECLAEDVADRIKDAGELVDRLDALSLA